MISKDFEGTRPTRGPRHHLMLTTDRRAPPLGVAVMMMVILLILEAKLIGNGLAGVTN